MMSLSIGRKIGQGTYGSVFECHTQDKSMSLAVKITKPDRGGIGALLEVSIMKTYVHPNINSCEYALYENSLLHIFQERAVCDLREEYSRTVPDKMTRILWMSHLLRALDVLHSESIVHCDIKPDNVLVYECGTAKLSDFTHSVISFSRKFSHRVGSVRYSAPEVLAREEWDEKIDIWSLGCTFYFILCGRDLVLKSGKLEETVYGELCEWRDRNTTYSAALEVLQLSSCHAVTDLVEEMLSFYPQERPSVAQIINKGVIKVEQGGYVIEGPLKLKRDSNIYSRMLSLIGDEEVAKMGSSVHRRACEKGCPHIPGLLKLETCVWIAHKVIFGRSPEMKGFKSQLHSILCAEVSLCTYLDFRLHIVV